LRRLFFEHAFIRDRKVEDLRGKVRKEELLIGTASSSEREGVCPRGHLYRVWVCIEHSPGEHTPGKINDAQKIWPLNLEENSRGSREERGKRLGIGDPSNDYRRGGIHGGLYRPPLEKKHWSSLLRERARPTNRKSSESPKTKDCRKKGRTTRTRFLEGEILFEPRDPIGKRKAPASSEKSPEKAPTISKAGKGTASDIRVRGKRI